jgi:hypothetical protein
MPCRLWADGGNCVKYKVTIYLNTNKTITGFLLIGSYEPRFEFKDLSLIDYIKSLHRDTLELYTEIKELVYPTTNYSPNCDYHYDAISIKAVIKVSPNDIKSIDLLGYSGCNKCDKDFYFSGLEPIFELNDKEIRLLQSKPIADSSFSYNAEMNPNLIWIISYNKDYGKDKIGQIWFEYFNQVKPYIEKENWKPVIKNYLDLKNRLRKLDIIVFEIIYSI